MTVLHILKFQGSILICRYSWIFLCSCRRRKHQTCSTHTLLLPSHQRLHTNPLKRRGNYMYHLLYQSLTVHFVLMVRVW